MGFTCSCVCYGCMCIDRATAMGFTCSCTYVYTHRYSNVVHIVQYLCLFVDRARARAMWLAWLHVAMYVCLPTELQHRGTHCSMCA